MSDMIQKMVVLGSGMQLAMSTAILASSLKSFNVKVVAVELPDKTNPSQIEICGPEFSPLCEILGLSEVNVVRECTATFRLGDRYLVDDKDWFVPFAHMGLKAEQDDFEQGLFQCVDQKSDVNLSKYCAASSAALTGKFAIAGSDRADLRKALEYGVQLDTNKYLTHLKQVCQQTNVEWIDCANAKLEIKFEQNGELKTVSVEGQTISADFWIDVSSDNLLSENIEQAANVSTLPISYICEWHVSNLELSKPYTQYKNLNGAWLRTTPLRDRTIHQLFTTNGDSELPQLEKQLASLNIDGPTKFDWRKVKCQSRINPWYSNVLTVGNHSLQLAGLAVSELQCIQAALVQFVDLFPSLPIGEHNRCHYNQEWQKFVQDAVDYSSIHFLHSSTDFNGLPNSLINRIQVFERLGRLTPMHSDAVTESQWYNILYGMGLRPQLPSVVLSKFSLEKLETGLHKVERSIAGLVGGMPPHEQYLNRFYPMSSSQ